MREDRISVALRIPAAPERVWHALTEGRAAWWPSGTEVTIVEEGFTGIQASPSHQRGGRRIF